MESAGSGHCNTSLHLGLGFRQDLRGRLEKKKRKSSSKYHRRSDKLFPFLALGFSEPTHKLKEEEDTGGQKRSGATAAASSFTGVSSLFSQASKLSDEEDEDYSTPRKKLRLAKDQILALEDTFKVHSTLNPKQKQELATQLSLLPRQVEVWFQNRRARVKVKQTEIEREELRKSCESLKEENRRLKKEVMNFKSAKPTIPFLMHVGTPIPSICPSCGCTSGSNNSNGSEATC